MPPGVIMVRDILTISAIIVGLVLIARLVQASILHRTLRRAIDREPASAVELMKEVRQPRVSRDDRNGLILVALGIALAGFGWMLDDNPTRIIYGASFFPVLVGAALLGRWWVTERRRPGRNESDRPESDWGE